MSFTVTAAGFNVTNPGVYDIHDEGFTFNGVNYQQTLVESQFIHGAVETSRKKSMVACSIKLDVFGGNDSDLAQERLADIVDALANNGDWELQVLVNSTEYKWRCMAANSYEVGPFSRFFEENILDVTFGFLRYPVPLVGGVG